MASRLPRPIPARAPPRLPLGRMAPMGDVAFDAPGAAAPGAPAPAPLPGGPAPRLLPDPLPPRVDPLPPPLEPSDAGPPRAPEHPRQNWLACTSLENAWTPPKKRLNEPAPVTEP